MKSGCFENTRGDKEWLLNDQLHRDDGPAIERADGTKVWYRNGQLHREDGPAVELANGDKEWWLDGKKTTAAAVPSLRHRTEHEIDRLEKDIAIITEGLRLVVSVLPLLQPKR